MHIVPAITFQRGQMLSISRNVRLSVRLSFCLFVCLFTFEVPPSGSMLSISQNVGPCVRVSVYLFTFKVPFKCLFAPTTQSWMSNIFRHSESLGTSNGKKWSQIGTFLFGSGLQSPNKKKNFAANFGIFLDVFEFVRLG